MLIYQKNDEIVTEHLVFFPLLRLLLQEGNHKPFYCNDVLSKLQLITIFHVRGEATHQL
jgi:hypothetical protein